MTTAGNPHPPHDAVDPVAPETPVDPADGMIGRVVAGRYRIVALIARGGMASVFRAVDDHLGRTVALKVLHPGLAMSESFVQGFITEARAAARVSHDPTIVTLYDHGRDGAVVWIAMEYVPGTNLRVWLSEHGPLPVAEALTTLRDVLRGLATAHGADLIHRDVKPDNVLLCTDGRLLVTDFGLARAALADPVATRGVLLGTVTYLSPEQALGRPATKASDVYAAGILAFEMLTGAPPHTGDTDFVVVSKHVQEDAPAVSSVIADVPGDVDDLVRRALARDVADRFPDAAAFLAALEACLAAHDWVAAPNAGQVFAAAGAVTSGPLITEDASETAVLPKVAAKATAVIQPAAAAASAAAAAHAPATPAEPATAVIPNATRVVEPLGPSATTVMGTAATAVMGTVPAGDTTSAATGLIPVADATAGLMPVADATADDAPAQPDDPAATAARARRRRILLLSLIPVIAVIGFVWWYLAVGRIVTTPDLVKLTVAEAQAAADEVGLSVAAGGEVYSETVPAGNVAGTDPAGGADAVRGSTVTLKISKGPERYTVPNLAGKTKAEAQRSLTAVKLVLQVSGEQYSETVAKGSVISQSVAAGEQVKRGTKVPVAISRGREPITVPTVVGVELPRAQQQLTNLGLRTTYTTEYSDSVKANVVMSQTPSSGTLYRDDEVALVVSKGPTRVTVPNVEGKKQADAQKALEAAGLKASIVKLPIPKAKGKVSQQTPSAGSQVARGSTVTLFVL